MELEGVTVPAPEGGPADTWSQGSQFRASGEAGTCVASELSPPVHPGRWSAGLQRPEALAGLGEVTVFS